MSFLSRITGKAQDVVLPKAQKLPNRFIGDGGFVACGASKHAPRTNSSEEIIASIKLLAKEQRDRAIQYAKAGEVEAQRLAELKAKDIEDFIAQMAEMPQRHLSLAHDVVDLSNMSAFVNRDIFPTVDFNSIGKIQATGKETTLMGYVLNLLPGLSKANPKAVDLAETVASNADDSISRFFLSKFVDQFPIVGTDKQAEAAEGLVEPIAKSVLKGMPSMDLGPSSKEQTFFDMIRGLCGLDSKPENLKLLKQTLDATDDIAPHVNANINLDDIRVGDTQRIAENIELLPQLLENAEAQGVKILDVSGFLTKNVNLN